jgi:phosphomevalonate kinase
MPVVSDIIISTKDAIRNMAAQKEKPSWTNRRVFVQVTMTGLASSAASVISATTTSHLVQSVYESVLLRSLRRYSLSFGFVEHNENC